MASGEPSSRPQFMTSGSMNQALPAQPNPAMSSASAQGGAQRRASLAQQHNQPLDMSQSQSYFFQPNGSGNASRQITPFSQPQPYQPQNWQGDPSSSQQRSALASMLMQSQPNTQYVQQNWPVELPSYQVDHSTQGPSNTHYPQVDSSMQSQSSAHYPQQYRQPSGSFHYQQNFTSPNYFMQSQQPLQVAPYGQYSQPMEPSAYDSNSLAQNASFQQQQFDGQFTQYNQPAEVIAYPTELATYEPSPIRPNNTSPILAAHSLSSAQYEFEQNSSLAKSETLPQPKKPKRQRKTFPTPQPAPAAGPSLARRFTFPNSEPSQQLVAHKHTGGDSYGDYLHHSDDEAAIDSDVSDTDGDDNGNGYSDSDENRNDSPHRYYSDDEDYHNRRNSEPMNRRNSISPSRRHRRPRSLRFQHSNDSGYYSKGPDNQRPYYRNDAGPPPTPPPGRQLTGPPYYSSQAAHRKRERRPTWGDSVVWAFRGLKRFVTR